MSLKYFKEKIKSNHAHIFFCAAFIIVGLLGFGLGRLSKIEDGRPPVIIRGEELGEKKSVSQPQNIDNLKITNQSQYIASKTGNSYYLPWCVGAGKIKDINKIWFKTKEEAEGAGYKKASNCRGI
ncbi:MAG: hypothetical protein HY225_02020 [Candidatus Vogelbacteria bacterium]|nr:hypothetical protein [Candidatus Vogelbacteria bacterium]